MIKTNECRKVKLCCLIGLFWMVFLLSGCMCFETKNERITRESYKTDEFFFYENKIISFTEEIKNKDKLIIPTYLNGEKVLGIKEVRDSFMGSGGALSINCSYSNLPSIYLNEYISWQVENVRYYNDFTIKNAKNVFMPYALYSVTIKNGNGLSRCVWNFKHCENIYIPNNLFQQYMQLNFGESPTQSDFIVTQDLENNLVIIKLRSYGTTHLKPANISFFYNYENNPNEGYYFIDNVEGGIIEKPKYDPVREGYTFEGWYKEKGCLTEWNFEEDEVLKQEVYEEIKIYAKWRKN